MRSQTACHRWFLGVRVGGAELSSQPRAKESPICCQQLGVALLLMFEVIRRIKKGEGGKSELLSCGASHGRKTNGWILTSLDFCYLWENSVDAFLEERRTKKGIRCRKVFLQRGLLF